MSARDSILRRLASAEFREPLPPPDVAGYYARHRRIDDAAARLERFKTAIAAAHAEVHDCTAADWPQALCRIAAAKGLKSLLHGQDSADAARLLNAPRGDLKLIAYDRAIDAWRNELFNAIDAGLSRARSAIANTGSLVLWTGNGEPRLMSLVPPVHFVLLDAAAIHSDLHAAMTAEGWSGSLPTNALLISGPSKTADIQQTLAYGAHGPRELVVLIVHATGEQP